MSRKNAKDFSMNPALKKFQFEVAKEIGIVLNKEKSSDKKN